jgi:lipopolysaccharide export system protein LptC
MMSLRIDATHHVPRARAQRAAWRARRAPYVSGLFALIALGFLAVFLYQTDTFSNKAKPIEDVNLPVDKVTVSHSTITGLDRQNQPYAISARTAVQDRDKPNFIALDGVSGSVKRHNGDPVIFQSKQGFYDSDVKTLDLERDVVITSEGHFTARMDKAHIIVGEKRLTSSVPVAVEMKSGTINANGVEISDDGNNIKFLNGVRAHFKSSKPQGDSTP